MISCSEATRQLWAYLEAEVSERDAARIEEHLGLCRRCCGELEFSSELRDFLSRHADPGLPGDVQRRLEIFLSDLDGVEP